MRSTTQRCRPRRWLLPMCAGRCVVGCPARGTRGGSADHRSLCRHGACRRGACRRGACRYGACRDAAVVGRACRCAGAGWRRALRQASCCRARWLVQSARPTACPAHRRRGGAFCPVNPDRSGSALSRSPPFGLNSGAVQANAMPVDLSCAAQALLQGPVRGRPYPGLLPIAQPAPATHPRAAAHLSGQRLLGQARARASTLWSRPGRQQGSHPVPKVVGKKQSSHAKPTHNNAFC